MRRAYSRAVSLLVSVIVLGGCGAHQAAAPTDRPAVRSTQVHVTNNNWSDVRVYLVRNTLRVRLGMVTSASSASFNVPSTLMGPAATVHLEVRPLAASQRYVTPPLQVTAGQRIDFTVQNHLAISSVIVR
jgi:hypothetical protein